MKKNRDHRCCYFGHVSDFGQKSDFGLESDFGLNSDFELKSEYGLNSDFSMKSDYGLNSNFGLNSGFGLNSDHINLWCLQHKTKTHSHYPIRQAPKPYYTHKLKPMMHAP